MKRINQLASLFVPLAFVALSASNARTSTLYSISISTASVAGTAGFLDLQLNPGPDSQLAFVELLNFTSDGSLNGSPQVSGGVMGTLPGMVRIDNTTGFNDYFQPFLFGQSVSLVLALDGPALTSPDGTAISGSSFGLGLFDGNQDPILTTDPNGFIVTVEVNIDGTTTPRVFPASDGGEPAATIGSVPEPNSAVLIGLGMVFVLIFISSRSEWAPVPEAKALHLGSNICNRSEVMTLGPRLCRGPGSYSTAPIR